MTFTEFLDKHNGKYIDFDGYYGPQCMDLMHQYLLEVLGIPERDALASASARLTYVNFSTMAKHELFEQIGNTPTNIAQEGDLMFWGNLLYGHVAIFIEGDVNRFTSFDQNYPSGSPCHVQSHTYANVLGWLRFKENTNVSQELVNKLIDERNRNWNWLSGLVEKVEKILFS
mgnify:CR=1 FL=1